MDGNTTIRGEAGPTGAPGAHGWEGRRREGRGSARLAAVGAALLLVVFLVFSVSRAAFSATTGNAGNSLSTGSLALTDDDSGAAMFPNVSGLAPLEAVSRCIHVDFTGSLDPEPIRMFSSAPPIGSLPPYLDMTVEMGDDNGDPFGACSSFSPTSTLYTGTLASFGSTHSSYAAGLATWDPAGPSSRTFRITMTVQDDPAAAGLSAGWGLTWEARSS